MSSRRERRRFCEAGWRTPGRPAPGIQSSDAAEARRASDRVGGGGSRISDSHAPADAAVPDERRPGRRAMPAVRPEQTPHERQRADPDRARDRGPAATRASRHRRRRPRTGRPAGAARRTRAERTAPAPAARPPGPRSARSPLSTSTRAIADMPAPPIPIMCIRASGRVNGDSGIRFPESNHGDNNE